MNAPPLVVLVEERAKARRALVAELARADVPCRWEDAGAWEEASSALRRPDLEVLVVGLGSVLASRVLETARTHCASVPVVLVAQSAAETAALEALRPGIDVCVVESPGLAPRLASAVGALLDRISLRRRAVAAEARFATLSERLPVGLFRAAANGKVLEANPALFRIFSVPAARPGVEYQLADFCSPGQGVEEAVGRAVSTGQVQTLEAEVRGADGQSAWVAITLEVARDASGLACVDGVVEDVTERKKAEKALRATRVRESHLLASLPMVLYTVKGPKDLRTKWISENVERVTGVPRARFLNEPELWVSRIHPEDRPTVEAEIGGIEDGTSVTVEYRWKGAGAEWLWFLDHAILVRDAGGRGHEVLGTRLDVTERKRAERGMIEMATALENAVEGISSIDPVGKVIVANRAFAGLLGCEPYELVGEAWTDAVHPDDREKALAALRRMGDVGKAEAEVRAVRRDGTTPYFALTLVAGRSEEEGRIAGFYCFAKDVTDRREAEIELRARADQVQAIAGAMSQYLTTGDRRLAGAILVQEAVRQTSSGFGMMAVRSTRGAITVVAVEGRAGDAASRGEFRVASPGAPLADVLRTGAPVVLGGAAQAPALGEGLPAWRTFLGAPLVASGEIAGLLAVTDKPMAYTESDLARVQVLCQAGGTLLEPLPGSA